MIREFIQGFLAHPATRGLDLDDPELLHKRQAILREKVFLRSIYQDWYQRLTESLDTRHSRVLELGSGAGFLQEQYPKFFTSDVIYIPGLSVVLNGQVIPFKPGCLDAIVLCNVLHHLPDVQAFFRETARCTHSLGQLIMIEPWVTPWSRFIYTNLHHEDFDPDAAKWELPIRGHLSGANGALPWIVFSRDHERFEAEHPEWRIENIEPFMPFLYLLSGGISGRTLMPGWTYSTWKSLEKFLYPWKHYLAMFAFIRLIRR